MVFFSASNHIISRIFKCFFMFYFETQRKRDENDKIVVKRKLEMEGLESNLDKRKEGKKGEKRMRRQKAKMEEKKERKRKKTGEEIKTGT